MGAGIAGVVAAAVVAVTVVAAPPSARIVLRSGSTSSGSTVYGFGDGFDPFGGNVQISLSGPSGSGGPNVWSGRPDHDGVFAFGFTVPSTAPGSYTVVAAQNSPESATQATAPLQITAGQPVSDDDNGQSGQGNHSQPSQLPHVVPSGPSVTAASNASQPPNNAAAGASADAASSGALVFGVPVGGGVQLPNRPPQVATLWRVAGAVPASATTAATISAPAAAAPATSTESRGAPSVLTLAALGVVMASAIVVIATTLQLRSPEAPPQAPAPTRAAEPQHQAAVRRSSTMRSSDVWSGSPARFH